MKSQGIRGEGLGGSMEVIKMNSSFKNKISLSQFNGSGPNLIKLLGAYLGA